MRRVAGLSDATVERIEGPRDIVAGSGLGYGLEVELVPIHSKKRQFGRRKAFVVVHGLHNYLVVVTADLWSLGRVRGHKHVGPRLPKSKMGFEHHMKLLVFLERSTLGPLGLLVVEIDIDCNFQVPGRDSGARDSQRIHAYRIVYIAVEAAGHHTSM